MNSLAHQAHTISHFRLAVGFTVLLLVGTQAAYAHELAELNWAESDSLSEVVIASPVAQQAPAEAGGEDEIEKQEFNACEALEEGALFKPVEQIRTVLTDDGKRMPPDCSEQFFTEQLDGASPRFAAHMPFHWQPTNFFHMPTYFDDVPLERYGQHRHPFLQPFISGTRFVLQVPVLPYKMGIDRPHSCVTTLGHRPPGDCVPCIRQRLPREADAALLQAAATVGLAFILP